MIKLLKVNRCKKVSKYDHFISQDTFLFEDTIKNNIIFDIDKKVDEKN